MLVLLYMCCYCIYYLFAAPSMLCKLYYDVYAPLRIRRVTSTASYTVVVVVVAITS